MSVDVLIFKMLSYDVHIKNNNNNYYYHYMFFLPIRYNLCFGLFSYNQHYSGLLERSAPLATEHTSSIIILIFLSTNYK